MGLQITWQVVHVAVPLWILEGSLPSHLIRFRTDLVQHLHTWAKRKHVVSGIGILFCRVPTYFKCITSIVYKALCHWTGWGLIHTCLIWIESWNIYASTQCICLSLTEVAWYTSLVMSSKFVTDIIFRFYSGLPARSLLLISTHPQNTNSAALWLSSWSWLHWGMRVYSKEKEPRACCLAWNEKQSVCLISFPRTDVAARQCRT